MTLLKMLINLLLLAMYLIIYKRIDGVIRRFHLGYFSTQEKAARAYNQKSLELYGEDAYQNKIEE